MSAETAVGTWKSNFLIKFADGSTSNIEYNCPHPQMFDIWDERITPLADSRRTTVTEIIKTNITPAGTIFPETPLVFTHRPPCRLVLNDLGKVICQNDRCNAIVSPYYAQFPDLICPHCDKSMYPSPGKSCVLRDK